MKASKKQIDLVSGIRREATTEAVTVLVPVKTKGANAREHWSAKARRVKAERTATGWALVRFAPVVLPCRVTFTRLSPGTLDDDNVRDASKGIRDEVAKWLGVDDRDPRVVWCYEQEKTRMKTKTRLADPIGVRVEIVHG